MTFLQTSILRIAIVLTACAASVASAVTEFDLSYTDVANGISGSGVVYGSLAGGGQYLLTSGNFTISVSPSFTATGFLTSPPSVRTNGGTDLITDNILSPASNPIVDGNGIAFGPMPFVTNVSPGFNIWGNSPNNYSVFFAGYGNSGDPFFYREFDGGILTITRTVTVPDGGMTVALLGLGIAVIGVARYCLNAKRERPVQ